MISVIAVIGTSGSGKTTTIEYLISHLSKDGFKVGSVKRIHHPDFSMDTEGKDTWRHRQAGAMMTVAIATKEIVMIKKTDTSQNNLDEIVGLFDEKVDVVFVEGFHGVIAKREDIPKIITAKDMKDYERTIKGTAPPIIAVTGPIVKARFEIRGLKTPLINLHDEGNLLLRLVKNQIDYK